MGKPYVPGKFNTGNPCKHGHLAERWVNNGQCVECKRIGDRPSNKGASKRYTLSTKYSLTVDQLREMAGLQLGKCAICLQLLDISNTVTNKATHVDHCHASGKVRGLLCNHCNRLLGGARDDIDILQRAIEYLTNNPLPGEYKDGKI